MTAADSADVPRGTLRITAPVAFAQVNLVPLLPEFARLYPELKFELLLNDRFLDLVDERIDIAVRLGRLAESSLIAHRLCEWVNVVCASPSYLRRHGRPKHPSELARHECLRYPMHGYGPEWRFAKGEEDALRVPVSGRLMATNGLALRECAVGGLGVLMLPRWDVARELRAGALVELFPEYRATASEFDAAVWMVYPSRSYLPLKVRVFADFLKAKFKHGAPAELILGARALAPPRRERNARR